MRRTALAKSLIHGALIIIFIPFFTYFFGKHLIKKKKVSWIKLTFFVLAMIFVFFLSVALFYFHLKEFLDFLKKIKE